MECRTVTTYKYLNADRVVVAIIDEDGVSRSSGVAEFVVPPGATIIDPDPVSHPVPASVTPRQFRMALTRAGLRAAVEAAISAGDQDTKDWYEYSTAFIRATPVLNAMATAMGKTPADIDNLFFLAATL